MTSHALVFASAAFLIGGCDVSQKRPETMPASAGVVVHAPADGVGTKAAGERSIRLMGPGVTRERQIRV
jgi:hypothetical protein